MFTDADYEQMRALGIDPARVREHLHLFARQSHFLTLDRPCTIGDGIQQLAAAEVDHYLEQQDRAARQGRFQSFIPASGAATRMFQVPLRYYHHPPSLDREAVIREAATGSQEAQDFLTFLDNLPRLAFFPELRQKLRQAGHDLAQLLAQGDFRPILHCLLTPAGLNCAALPKGLLQFHAYDDGNRTAFIEHLGEAAGYIRDKDSGCRMHFTVAEEFQEDFLNLFQQARPGLEERLQCRFGVGFSRQSPATNTIAVDLNNRPFRETSGRLLFRPGGHGALLANLRDLQGDLVYIKNIDNIVPDRLKAENRFWKRLLGGYLVWLQTRIHHYLRLLEDPRHPINFPEILDFIQSRLRLSYRSHFRHWPNRQQRDYLWKLLYRPVRVCGMVKNTGEPGGGPFWEEGKDGRATPQIIEAAQVDMSSARQQEIWRTSTHFNPVDLVCGMRDHRGQPFDLDHYVDPEAVFISRKTCDGRDLKALELPGLWNGAMSGWLSIFVEVPIITFNPVKSVLDLLRPEHLPA